MKSPFKKLVEPYQSSEPLTPYQKAQQEWDNRIGSARVQAKNWRITALSLLLITALASATTIVVLLTQKDRIFIAQVTDSGAVVNVAPLLVKYHPTLAQKEYFVAHFIELIRTLPLDPVLAKHNWLSAYNFLTPRTAAILNEYFRTNNPVTLLGKSTITPKISTIHPLGQKTLQVSWTETTINLNGQTEGEKHYSGVFTLEMKQPKTQAEILQNPLGIYLTDFHIALQESST